METAGPGVRRGLWAEVLGLALVYYGLGRLAWLLVPVPGQAVALWPSAGVALGMLLLRGLTLTPGVVLGAAALGLHVTMVVKGMPFAKAAPFALALGAAWSLGPLMAAVAVRHFIELPLRRARDTLTFAGLAGPAPAAISALACNGVLFWAGLLPRPSMALSIGVWWIGDALGALVFAPLVLLVFSNPVHLLPWRRRLAVLLPVAAATGLSVWLFARASAWDQRRAETVLQQRTDAITAAVQRSLTYHLDAVRALADFVGTDAKVDPVAFQRVATGAVVRHFSYEALAWAPAPLDRPPVTVALIEPSTTHTGLNVGLDLAAGNDWASKLSGSRHNGEALALPIDSSADPRRVWVFVPAPGRNGEQGIQGFFGAALRLDSMIERAVAEFGREGVVVELRDAVAPGKALFRMPASAGPGPFVSLAKAERPLVIADRTYVLAPAVSKAALTRQQSLEVWVVLLAGMLFVALLEGVLLVAAGRPRHQFFDVPLQHARAERGRSSA
jgi:hypothetical protein